MVTPEDPVVARRARIARVANLGKRAGYVALGIAIVAFFVGLATDFPPAAVTVCVAALVAACVILPVPIVLGYGVRAAARDEHGRR
jgi:hypothetical protein